MLERTQILLKKEQKRQLISKARTKGMTMAEAIREAVDQYVERGEPMSAKQALLALAENATSKKDYRPDINSENFRQKIYI